MEHQPNDRHATATGSALSPRGPNRDRIYVVGWYPLALWTDEKDYRRGRTSRFSREQLLADLKAEANSIRADHSVTTIPVLLDVPRPHSLVDEDAET
jgi:hypothetical protein